MHNATLPMGFVTQSHSLEEAIKLPLLLFSCVEHQDQL